MAKREIMSETDFTYWYDWLKNHLGEVENLRVRVACIEGFFKGKKDQAYTAEQVIKILALRYPEK